MKFAEGIMKRDELLWNKNINIPIVFWGCGNNARIIKKTLETKGLTPVAYCDNNLSLCEKKIDGVPVLSYSQVKEKYKECVFALTVAIGNAISIEEQLKAAGERNPICHIEKAFKCDEGFLEYDYMEKHIEDFEKIYAILQDEQSKEIFINNINYKLSGNKLPLLHFVDGDTFFDERIIPYKDNYSYMDVGAYTGDTLMRFYAFCRGKYDSVYAVDPDKGNFACMEKLVKYARMDNVNLYNVGGWDKKTELTFYTLIDNEERNFDSPNFFKDMEETVPNSCAISREKYKQEKIEVNTVDNLLDDARCDILKINALAADYQVLKGSKKTIERYKPIIVGEYGTQKKYLLEFLRYIKEIESAYKIYLRQKMIFGDCKTIYIAII